MTVWAAPKLGFCYNKYVVLDAKNLAAAGWHVSTYTDITDMVTHLGGSSVAGGHMKVTGTVLWLTPNTGADDSHGFHLKAIEDVSQFGAWSNTLLAFGMMYTNTIVGSAVWIYYPYYNSATCYFSSYAYNALTGRPVRLVKDSTSLSDGQTGIYKGNNGLSYNTICIGSKEYTSENLKETKFRDGSNIYFCVNGTVWAAQTDSAYCYYKYDAAQS